MSSGTDSDFAEEWRQLKARALARRTAANPTGPASPADSVAMSSELPVASSVESPLQQAEPPPLDRAMANLSDTRMALNTELAHVGGGVIKGTAGMLNFARGLNPLDFYNLSHPAEYKQSLNLTAAGIVSTAANPERIPGALIAPFKDDFSEGFGSAAPRPQAGPVPFKELGVKEDALSPVESYDDVIRDLNERGDGSRSVVAIRRPDGSGHVINAIKTPDGVVFLDGQTGGLATLERGTAQIAHIPYR
ncbi:toxin glutamine deamidase domain-containing protein [Streptomyces sp. NPDC020412]|uniref:toxin glutamine deamidase domain-containing protein n=1 Tax=Streptomyces sp. NPDC020412 TaxID=3365073 RepID=UPI00378FD828